MGAFLSVTAASDNLFVNGDFETGDSTGWTTYQSSAVSAEAAFDGSYGIRAVGDGGWGGLFNQTAYGLIPGEEYALSFWIKVVSNGVNFQLKENDYYGDSI